MTLLSVNASRPRQRLWWVYVAAWIPYFVLYATALYASGETSAPLAVVGGLNEVLPASVFGLGVLWVCSRVPWGSRALSRFFTIHAGAALLYAVLVAFSAAGLFVVTWSLLGAPHPESGLSEAGIFVWHGIIGLMLYTILASLTYAFHTTVRLREEERRTAHVEALKVKAELQALRAQINPHFLFNTLHSMIALVRSDSAAAEDAIEQFADLFRYASRVHQEHRDEVRFQEEWEFVQNYLALESLRVGDRLRVHTDLDDDVYDSIVPAFCLQPLVENVIRHVVAPRASGGTMWITASLDGTMLRLEVRDDGPGADPRSQMSNGRMGLRLVKQRLDALYGDGATFEIDTAPGRGFVVRLGLPAQREETHMTGERR